MTSKELSIGSILNQQDFGQIVVAEIFQDRIYAHLPDGKPLGMLMLDEVEPIEISEKYLLGFGFTKEPQMHGRFEEIYYTLEVKNVFFVYANDWSLAIADSKKSYEKETNYLTPDKELTDKVHLWQNLFSSLVGSEVYEKHHK
jgi:hypothetical protein